jgi:hypothetical protein
LVYIVSVLGSVPALELLGVSTIVVSMPLKRISARPRKRADRVCARPTLVGSQVRQ